MQAEFCLGRVHTTEKEKPAPSALARWILKGIRDQSGHDVIGGGKERPGSFLVEPLRPEVPQSDLNILPCPRFQSLTTKASTHIPLYLTNGSIANSLSFPGEHSKDTPVSNLQGFMWSDMSPATRHKLFIRVVLIPYLDSTYCKGKDCKKHTRT